MKTMNEPDLNRVAELVETRWARNVYSDDGLCLLQALAVTMTGDADDWQNPEVLTAGVRLFTSAIRAEFPKRCAIGVPNASDVWLFNDDPRTTRRDVLTVVRAAMAA